MADNNSRNHVPYEERVLAPVLPEEEDGISDHDGSSNGSYSEEEDTSERSDEDESMKLSPQERTWALAIKAAIEADPEIDNLNDYCYVQMAIACQGDVEEALEKARDMQGFRQEYDIRDNLEDARKTLWAYANLFDSCALLSFSYSKDEECYIATMDLAAMDNKDLKSERAWRNNLAGVYYIKQAMVPDFYAMKQGIVIIHECEGFDFWGKFGGMNHVSRLAKELVGSHPVIHREVKWFHTGSFVHLMLSMVKKVLPDDVNDNLQIGCLFHERLDKVLLVPDAETAKKRNQSRLIAALENRYEHEANFRL